MLGYIYIYKNVLKNCGNLSLKARHLCSVSESVEADIIDKKYKSFVSVFKSYGFSETQVSGLFSLRPSLVCMDKDGKIKPRLEFFREKGFSSSDLFHILALDPEIMTCNMKDLLKRAGSSERRYRSFVSIFKSYGFSETQLSSLFSVRPSLLCIDKDKKIKLKLEFFREKRFSPSDLCHILAFDPELMRRNMKDLIMPSYYILKNVFKNDDAGLIDAVRKCTWLFKQDLGKHLRPNVELLRNYGVPDDRIARMARLHPRSLLQNANLFKMVVEEVWQMGFEPVKSHFITACQVKSELSKTLWERKWNCYKKWGWSDDEIHSALLKQPNIMSISENKLDRVMDFLVNKMRWEVSKVVCCPAVVMHSLENWTVPRCLIIQFLLSKGALTKDFPLSTVIVSIESRFVENYVVKYSAEFPEVLELYASLQKNKTHAAGHVEL